MRIRKANIEDAKSIVEIHVNTWKTSYRGLIDDNILDQRLVVWTMKKAPSLKFYQKNNGTLTGNEKIWKYNVPIVELEWTL